MKRTVKLHITLEDNETPRLTLVSLHEDGKPASGGEPNKARDIFMLSMDEQLLWAAMIINSVQEVIAVLDSEKRISLTDQQVENWRVVLLGIIGPYAMIMPKYEIELYARKLQNEANGIK